MRAEDPPIAEEEVDGEMVEVEVEVEVENGIGFVLDVGEPTTPSLETPDVGEEAEMPAKLALRVGADGLALDVPCIGVPRAGEDMAAAAEAAAEENVCVEGEEGILEDDIFSSYSFLPTATEKGFSPGLSSLGV